MEKTLDDILKRINAQLTLKGITQADFSIKMGKGSQWLTKLKYDKRDLKVIDLIKACKLLDVNIAELLPADTVVENYTIKFEELVRRIVREELRKRNNK